MKLTPREVDLLSHRLSAPDAIEDAILGMSEEAHPCPWSREEIGKAAFDLDKTISITGGLNIALLGPLDKMILADCLEGSTWAVPTDEDDDHKAAAKVMRKLKAKFVGVGIEVFDLPV